MRMKDRACLFCNKVLKERHQIKFCSNQCQANFRYKTFKEEWLSGKRKVITKNISVPNKEIFTGKVWRKMCVMRME